MTTPDPDAGFSHPRLIGVYDVAEAGRDDLDHYERIVGELGAASVIDIGCGSGTFACRLAQRGLSVVGVDPAEASLAIARLKPGADAVDWILGDTSSLAAVSSDMAVMTGNVAQVFISDEGWLETLTAVHSALNPDGHLVFETRDPAAQAWQEWTKAQSHSFLDVPAEGQVETWVELLEVSLPYVTFRWSYRFERDGAELYSISTLRFRNRAEIEENLRATGFDVLDVRDAPDRPGKEFVFIANRSG